VAGLKVDLEAQRAAMAKLAFLIGKWEGEARIYRGGGGPGIQKRENRNSKNETREKLEVFHMTEEASWRLDGLILLIEGTGRNMAERIRATREGGASTAPTGGQRPPIQALGFLCYDDAEQTYRFRAFNDGRFLESEAKLAHDGKGLEWGFAVEHVRTRAVLRINERGEWTEEHQITIGEQPARRFMEVVVRKKG